MTSKLLVSTEELSAHLEDPGWLIADCRFTLSRPEEKTEYYLRAHIPGAIYVHLDRDLSARVIPGVTGRHPLPAPAEAARRFGRMGIGPGVQVVAYDDQAGSLAAVRLWFMLRWLGHEAAAVLDGGWQKWVNEDRPVKSGMETRQELVFLPRLRDDLFVSLAEVEALRLDQTHRLIDVRANERYTGETEPIDPVAGHIPGALNAPYTENLTPEGTFRSPADLRRYYLDLLNGVPPERAVFYCGSGVTSIHSQLAMTLAGLEGAKVYPGSWSEWIADRQRPVSTGPDSV
jgi:thiosulfate/3-mercaptopyruvate sulfurtransferase